MGKPKKTIWIDFTNTPHVNFFHPIYKYLNADYDFIFSTRDFAETELLFSKTFNMDFESIGTHKGKNKILKVLGVFERIWMLRKSMGEFDIKISIGGDSSCVHAKLKRKTSITFDDNEKAPNWRYSRFSDFAFWPRAIDPGVLKAQGFKTRKLYRYNGYKEDVYIADYTPDKNFVSNLPFDNYLLIRPENIHANYIKDGSVKSITPALLSGFSSRGYNILYLPRYKFDREYAGGIKNVYVPEGPVNGLDACYFADAVLTGAGTFAREAACLGIPSFSFYAGREMLSVDLQMIRDGWMQFSRDSGELFSGVEKSAKKEPDLNRCKTVQKEVIGKLAEVLSGIR